LLQRDERTDPEETKSENVKNLPRCTKKNWKGEEST
jgi:hypothetical protein